MNLLYSIHDRDAHQLVPAGGWIVESIALAENPQPQNWTQIRGDINWILRLNYAHNGRDGTIPLRGQYDEFAKRCTDYMAETKGCNVVVISNEPNHAQEYPNGVPIAPEDYSDCFNLCYRAITYERPDVEVCVAAVAPWDITSGIDWLAYYKRMLAGVIECDGLAVHGYTHGADPALIWSVEKTHGWYWHFPVIYQTIQAIPPEFATRPIHITETDQGDHAWVDINTHWVQNAYQSVNDHNETPGTQKICSLALYRWRGDKYAIYDKHGVQDDFRAAVERGYRSPVVVSQTPPFEPEPPEPTPAPEPPLLPPEPLKWDARLTARGCTLQHALMPSDLAPLVTVGRWFDREQAEGRISVYVRLLDELRRLVIGVPVTWFWSSGSETKLTERKSDPWLESKGLGREYSCDFAMYEPAPSYGVRIEGDYRGDIIDGCGLGSIEQPDWKIHTAYFFEWQLTPSGVTEPPILPPPVVPLAGHLIWPVSGPITQRWGENPQFYQEALGIPYHNGTDVGIPVGTAVIASADGIVKWAGDDPKGYGLYCRVYLPAFRLHILTAHLDRCIVQVGETVQQGQVIAYSGNSGLSSGPHCHVETRIGTEHTYAQGTFGNSNGRVDPQAVFWAYGGTQEPSAGPGR